MTLLWGVVCGVDYMYDGCWCVGCRCCGCLLCVGCDDVNVMLYVVHNVLFVLWVGLLLLV